MAVVLVLLSSVEVSCVELRLGSFVNFLLFVFDSKGIIIVIV